MLPIIMTREFIARSTKMPRSIGRLSASALSHHGLSSAVFITNIAESDFRYTHVLGAAPALIDEKRMLSLHRGLNEAGYIDGQNVVVSYLRAEGAYDRLASLAVEFVRSQVSVIVTPNSGLAARAAREATTTIPIVFSVATGNPSTYLKDYPSSPPRWRCTS
jgi:ABC-type uncharacterized transport system substrate-binding protein